MKAQGRSVFLDPWLLGLSVATVLYFLIWVLIDFHILPVTFDIAIFAAKPLALFSLSRLVWVCRGVWGKS